jgi:hypothetical protein
MGEELTSRMIASGQGKRQLLLDFLVSFAMQQTWQPAEEGAAINMI